MCFAAEWFIDDHEQRRRLKRMYVRTLKTKTEAEDVETFTNIRRESEPLPQIYNNMPCYFCPLRIPGFRFLKLFVELFM